MKKLRIREWRERRSLSQAELAERAGIAKLTVTRLEGSEPIRPHPRTVRSLAQALEVEPMDLWMEDERIDFSQEDLG